MILLLFKELWMYLVRNFFNEVYNLVVVVNDFRVVNYVVWIMWEVFEDFVFDFYVFILYFFNISDVFVF